MAKLMLPFWPSLSLPIFLPQPTTNHLKSTVPPDHYPLPHLSAHSGYAPDYTAKSALPAALSLAEVSPTKYIRFRPTPATSAKN